MGSLQGALPEPVSAEVEEKLLEILKRKMKGAVSLQVQAVRAVEREYGPEGREALRRDMARRASSPRDTGADNSLRAFCTALEEGCRGSHEWEKLADSDTCQAYRFTRCMWAEIYRELGAADIGFWICEGDGPAAAAFNPEIRFRRTKTLMEGDDCCDHVYYTGEEPA